jgi:hypothetical protein
MHPERDNTIVRVDDDLTWAYEDLAHAARLYERVRETSESVDESWEHNGYRWRLIARPDNLPDGRPDAYLTARGESGRSRVRFNWHDGAWRRAVHVEFDG